MKIERFLDLLDRFGTDLNAWPAAEGQCARRLLTFSGEARRRYGVLAGIESRLTSSRPNFVLGDGRALVRRTLFEIAQQEAHPRFVDRLRLALSAPLPGMAFALCLAAFGFAIGLAVGNPHLGQSDSRYGGYTMAMADDVLN